MNMQIVNDKGYTKHYFEENKRVCSNIGGGFRYAGYDIMDSIELITPFLEQWRNAKDGIFKTFEQCIKSPVDLENTQEKIVKVMKNHEKNRNEEEYQFYYTNDHLGSSTYITNKEGQITQTLAYLPYGEDWVDLDNHPPYLTPYKFNGKEKDEETGYNYYGARYLNNELSIWLSVDPLSDKYPHLTSYNYCANNPVMLVDPDGREIWISGDDAQRAQVESDINKKFKGRFTVNIDSWGKLTYKTEEGANNFTFLEQAFMDAADDTDVISQLNVTEENSYEGIGFVGGGCLGSDKMGDKILSQQAYNPTHAKIIEEHGGPKASTTIVHEILEGYFMGKDSPEIRPSLNKNENEKYKSAYNYNHARAVNIDQQLKLEYNGLKTDAQKGTATINGKTINVYEMAKNRNKKQ